MPKEYERLPEPEAVWVHHGPGEWCPGHILGRLRWPGRRWSELEVEYNTNSGQHQHRVVWESRVCGRRPMAEPEKNAPCAQCGTSRADCDRREQAEWPPYCCPRCRRSRERYLLHTRPR